MNYDKFTGPAPGLPPETGLFLCRRFKVKASPFPGRLSHVLSHYAVGLQQSHSHIIDVRARGAGHHQAVNRLQGVV